MDTFFQGSEILLQATFYDSDGAGRKDANVSFALQYLSEGQIQFHWFDWKNRIWVSERNTDCELFDLSDNLQGGFMFSQSGEGGYTVTLNTGLTLSLASGIYKWEFTVSDLPQDKHNGLFELKPESARRNLQPYSGPGMTLRQITDEVCRRCFKDTPSFRAIAKNWVNEAQQKISVIANGKWWWLETSECFEINANDTQITLPADYFELVDANSVKDITNGIILKHLDHKEFESVKTSLIGQPDKFCVYSKSIDGSRILSFDPVSGGARTLFISYYKVLPDMQNESDVSEIPYWYQYLLIEFAVMRGHEYRQQAEMAQIARSNWLEGIGQLMIEADKHNSLQAKPKWRW